MIDSGKPAQAVIDEFVGASHGDLATVRRLLAKDPRLVNANASWGETPIQAAAQMGHGDIAALLLAAGAPLDICTAAALGRTDAVEEMLRADPELAHATGAHGIPFLYFAVVADRADIAEMALTRGADINAGAGGTTPLHGAAMFGRTEMGRWLLDHGADPGALNYDAKTALDVAEAAGSSGVADLLRTRALESLPTGS